jgi:RNA 2',3'-cyclic 3'-phosphodiesterase
MQSRRDTLLQADGTTADTSLAERLTDKIRPPRVFVGVRIAPDIAQKLAEMAQPLKADSVRLVPGGDVHLTLVPPWNEANLVDAIDKLRRAICDFDCLSLAFDVLRYGPTPRRPHLVWVECVASNELIELRTALLAAYGQRDPRPFRPHVTLARIPKDGRTFARKNPMGQNLSFSQQVTSVELFQSPLKSGSGYQVLASLPLGTKSALQAMPPA